MRRVTLLLLISSFIALLTACGGGSSPQQPQQQIAVTISPSLSAITAGTTQQFNATVSNARNNSSVTWQVNGVTGGNTSLGTISGGLYTAPANISSALTVTITATSVEDATKSATVMFTVNPPASIAVSISPTPPTSMNTGTSIQFNATVSNAKTNVGVTWDVNGVPGGNSQIGTINAGLYTAPLNPIIALTVMITATSIEDPTKHTSVSFKINLPPVSVTVSPSIKAVPITTEFLFTANVIGTINPGVTWEVNGIPGGNETIGIINGGRYIAPSVLPNPTTVTITARLMEDPTKTGTATVTLNADIAVEIWAGPMTLATGAETTLGSRVYNTTNTALTWQVNSVTGGNATVGTIDSTGHYTAPKNIPSNPTIRITAISQADPTKSASVSLTIVPTTLQITPSSTTIRVGDLPRHFYATVTDRSLAPVTWQVNGVAGGNASVGTITAAGDYTPPSTVPSPATVTITAFWNDDPTVSGTSAVTIQPMITVQVSPATKTLLAGFSLSFTATVSGVTWPNDGVTWMIEGYPNNSDPTKGSIDGWGKYTAPDTVPIEGITLTIVATSLADPWRTGRATLTVVPNPYTDFAGAQVFTYSGFDHTGFATLAGTFVADLHGNLTNGNLDMNVVDPRVGAFSSTFGGTYDLDVNGYGTATLNVGGQALKMRFALLSTGTSGRIMEYDGLSSGVGSIEKFPTTPIAASDLDGDFAFTLIGIDTTNALPVSTVGRFTSSGGGISGEQDVAYSGVGLQGQALTGSWNSLGTNKGRLTLSVSQADAIQPRNLTLDMYMVSKDRMILLGYPVNTQSQVVLGYMERQTGLPFASSTFQSSSYAFGVSGPSATGLTNVALAGFARFAIQTGGVNGYVRRNIGGAPDHWNPAATISVTTEGRGEVVLRNDEKLTVYAVSPQKLLAMRSQGLSGVQPAAGDMLMQTSDTFTKEQFTGSYLVTMTGSAGQTSCNALGPISMDGSYTLTTTAVADCNGSLTENIGAVGSYYIYDPWGWAEFHATFGTTSARYYDAILVSPSKLFVVSNQAGEVQFGVVEKTH